MSDYATIPKIIWRLWLQGWESAPRVVQASLQSWEFQNPGWRVHRLDRQTLSRLLPETDLAHLAPDDHPAAQSDQIRIALLHRYGGVWADATTLCMAPLDTWLPAFADTGFFAFSQPSDDRMLASWFLAAQRGSYIVERWREAVIDYWKAHRTPHDYFWFHQLFGETYKTDWRFRKTWDATPVVSARHPGHFSPDDERLLARADNGAVGLIEAAPAPVLKLTHKFTSEAPPSGRVIDKLCDWAETLAGETNSPPAKRLLVAWYGSFAGHGTVGDILALEALVTHLVGRGHNVSHATADSVDITGAGRVQWDGVDPQQFDAVLFVCGPILNFHPQTNALFERFRNTHLAGIGVSLMPPGGANHTNPFEFVLAREGLPNRYGDLAIVSPADARISRPARRTKVGISLRGHQTEYGGERCRWRETETLAREMARAACAENGGQIIEIENHLGRSGRSAAEIEQQYAECALVITSRFHGAIAALRQSVPFIAIDQIEGGAKLISLLSPLPWPHVYSIDRTNTAELKQLSAQLASQSEHPMLLAARNASTRAANETLAALDEWLTTLN